MNDMDELEKIEFELRDNCVRCAGTGICKEISISGETHLDAPCLWCRGTGITQPDMKAVLDIEPQAGRWSSNPKQVFFGMDFGNAEMHTVAFLQQTDEGNQWLKKFKLLK